MKLYYFIPNKLNLLLVPLLLFFLASCSSYQYSGYEADGIYGESRPGIFEQEREQTTEVRPNNNNSYYKNLFGQQSQMVGEVLESEIFTDADSYTSNDGYENYSEVGGDVAYVGGNAPWGQDPDTYTVNIYNNGFYGGYNPWAYGFGYGDPFFGGWYDPFYYPGYWGPYAPFAYGYGRSRWRIGFGVGFGYGYGYGYAYGPFYSPFYYPYHHHHYNSRYYNDRIAYNRTGRDSYVDTRDGESRRSSYSRSIRDIRSSRSSDYGTSRVRGSVRNDDNARVYSRTSRRTESTRSYDNSNRSRSSSPVYQRRSSSSNNSTYRSTPSRRSNSSSTRSSSVRSSSRSGSSGTTTRSSGGRSSRGGRGGN